MGTSVTRITPGCPFGSGFVAVAPVLPRFAVGQDARQVSVTAGTNGFRHHHLQNQVGAAAQIKPKVDAICEGLLERCRTEPAGKTNDTGHEHQQDGKNKDSFSSEILTHLGLQGYDNELCALAWYPEYTCDFITWFILRGGNAGDGGLDASSSMLSGARPELDYVVLDGNDHAADAARSRHAIAGLQLGQHFLPCLLAPLAGRIINI